MPSFAMTVPYMRTSPLHIPRRDLVLAAADSLYLRVTIVDSDNPCAQAIETGPGIGSPSAQFVVWPDSYYRGSWGCGGWGYDYRNSWDYGTFSQWPPTPLLTISGAVSDALGAFDFTFPSGTMSGWPRRCRWAVQLNYDTTGAEVLMSGSLHVRILGTSFLLPVPVLETDDFIPVHTDTEEQVLA